MKESLESDVNVLSLSLFLLKSFSARADAEAWVKTNVVENPSSSSIAAEVRPTIPTNTQKRKAHTNSTKQTSITEYLDKNEEEFEDDDDGWTTEYEPMKPLSSPPAKRTTTVRGKSNGNNTKRKLNTSAKANAGRKRTLRFGIRRRVARKPGTGRCWSVNSSAENTVRREREKKKKKKKKGVVKSSKRFCTSLGVATVKRGGVPRVNYRVESSH